MGDFCLQALLELDASASSDEAVRERIASLPPEVSEVQLLSKLEGKMTPYYRINFVITLVARLRNLKIFITYLESLRDKNKT